MADIGVVLRAEHVHTQEGLNMLKKCVEKVMATMYGAREARAGFASYLPLWVGLANAKAYDIQLPRLVAMCTERGGCRHRFGTAGYFRRDGVKPGVYSGRVRLELSHPGWRPVPDEAMLDGPRGTECSAKIVIYGLTWVHAREPEDGWLEHARWFIGDFAEAFKN